MRLSSVSLVATALAAIAGTAIASGPPHEHRQGPAYGGASLAYSGPPPPAHHGSPHHGSPARHSTPPGAPAQTEQTHRSPRGGTHILTRSRPGRRPISRIALFAKLAAAQESAASAWGIAAEKADRLSAAQPPFALEAAEYRKKQTENSEKAQTHRSDEQYFRENGQAAKPNTSRQGHRISNSARASTTVKGSKRDAQTTNAYLDGHLQSLGIDFEAERAAQKLLLLREAERAERAAHELLLLHHTPTHY